MSYATINMNHISFTEPVLKTIVYYTDTVEEVIFVNEVSVFFAMDIGQLAYMCLGESDFTNDVLLSISISTISL